MLLKPFRIERYYAQHEFSTRYMLSSSDCESRTVAELLELEPGAEQRLLDLWCGYTEPSGAPELREAIAALYESALELARSTGADVSEWRRGFTDGWAHDLEALRAALRPATRVLYLNQPHNPTGTLMDRATFDAVADLAAERGLVLFSDEVYRELEHDPADRLPAACDVLAGGVSLGSISKSYGLPGLRLGWLVTRDAELRARLLELKDYTTICSSAPSELLTAVALRHRERLVARNLDLVAGNLEMLEQFFARHRTHFAWVPPTASPIGFPRVSGLPDHVRVGFGRANLPEALQLLEETLGQGDARGRLTAR